MANESYCMATNPKSEERRGERFFDEIQRARLPSTLSQAVESRHTSRLGVNLIKLPVRLQRLPVGG